MCLLGYKCSNGCKIMLDHLMLHFSADNMILMCKIGEKSKMLVEHVFQKEPVCALKLLEHVRLLQ